MFIDPDAEFLLDPGTAETPHELELTRAARLFQQARSTLRPLLRDLAFYKSRGGPFPLTPPALALFLACTATFLPLCEALVASLEAPYQSAQAHLAQVQAQHNQRAAFLQHFSQHLLFVGTDTPPRTYSHLGWIDDHPEWPVAVSRDHGMLILGTGVQGCGKTILSTLLGEGCQRVQPPLTAGTVLPTAYLFFHIEEHDRLPQLLDSLKPNPKEADLEILRTRLGLEGASLGPLRLALPDHLRRYLGPRLVPYQELGLEVVPLRVRPGQLGQPGLEAFLGAESGARYIERMLEDAQDQGADLDIGCWHQFIDDAEDLDLSLKRKAHARLRGLSQLASGPEEAGLWEMVGPEVTTVFYLGGPHMGHGATLPAVVGLLQGVMLPSAEHGEFQRLIVVDEVNLFDGDEAAKRAFTRGARMVRHLGSMLVLLGQDLLKVPDELFGLAGICAVGKLRNPRVWQHLVERVGALSGYSFREVAELGVAEMLLATTELTDPAWRGRARKVKVRPPRCQHGGQTRSMI